MKGSEIIQIKTGSIMLPSSAAEVGRSIRPIGKRIAAEAERWIDTPFHWQGQVRGVGCDCKGLVAGVARACGRAEGNTLEAMAGDYATRVPIDKLRLGLERHFDRVSERQPGDILLVRMAGDPQHLAIAAPTECNPDRAIEAMPTGPKKVRPVRILPHRVAAIYRWRD